MRRLALQTAAALCLGTLLLAGCSSGSPGSHSSPVAISSGTDNGSANPATSSGIRLPPAHGRFDYQLGGAYPPQPSVTIVDRDRSAPPAPGRYNICYLNAFQTQPGEVPGWQADKDNLLLRKANGDYVEDPDWPGELLLDTSSAVKRTAISAVLDGWIAGCAKAGYQAVEPDNLDSWTRSDGRLTMADNVALARLITGAAHRRHLAVAQKNGSQLDAADRTAAGFDFAIAEECQHYAECDYYTGAYRAHVIEIEYTDNPRRDYSAACAARGASISVILRDRAVSTPDDADYRYESC